MTRPLSEPPTGVNDRTFNVPPWDGHGRAVALLWRLAKRGMSAECRLWTNPKGAEIRVEAGGQFVRSEAANDPLALVATAMTWKAQFQEKGWTS